MGPKNEVVLFKDSAATDLSWIDRMYEKLEGVCVEVDKNPSLIFQETTKYVENQMNTVGSNVRNFCSELIQDLLPPTDLLSDTSMKKPNSSGLWHCEAVATVAEDEPKEAPNFQEKGSTTMQSVIQRTVEEERDEQESEKKIGHIEQRALSHEEDAADQVVDKEDLNLSLESINASVTQDLSSCSKEEDFFRVDRFIVEQAEEDQEQRAQWFVSEKDRRVYRVRNSTSSSSSSSLNCFDDDLQGQNFSDDIELDWELI